jgi:chromosome segregation ATPase
MTRNAFPRRSSENNNLIRNSLNTSKTSINSPKMAQSQVREVEDTNLKLKKQVEDLTEKSERIRSKWETKLELQKKTIQDCQAEIEDSKTQLIQTKTKHQKELNKCKDVIKKMERDMRNLKKGVDEVQKEKSQLNQKLMRSIDGDKSIPRNNFNKRHDLSRDVNRSHNDLDLFSKRNSCLPKGNGASFDRKNSVSSKRNNQLFSSTTSLKSYNLLKSTKNLSKKALNDKCEECEQEIKEKESKGTIVIILIFRPCCTKTS